MIRLTRAMFQNTAVFIIAMVIFGGLGYVTYMVMLAGADGLKNIVVQAWIILASGAAGFYFGTTKSAADQAQTLNRVLAQQQPMQATASIAGIAALTDPSDPTQPAAVR